MGRAFAGLGGLLGLGLWLAGASPGWDGKVVRVQGERVEIALGEGAEAKPGFQVEIYTPGEELAGFWTVVAVRGATVSAVGIEVRERPLPGWRATVYDAEAVAAPSTPPPWGEPEPGAEKEKPPAAAEFVSPFPPPPPGAFVSTRGYLRKLPGGGFEDGFENFRRWARSRGPGDDEMRRACAGRKRSEAGRPFPGLWLVKNEEVLCQSYATGVVGLVVVGVCPGSGAARAGLQVGDLILKADGRFVCDPLVPGEAGSRLALEVERDSRLLEIELEPEYHD